LMRATKHLVSLLPERMFQAMGEILYRQIS
jgi:hypothetical protein